MEEYDYFIKVIIIGESGVGKSAILNVYCDNLFVDNFISTIGVDFKMKHIKIGDSNVKLQIWDTAGQERFRTVTSSYYRGAKAVILVFDLSDKESFVKLTKWMYDVNNNMGNNSYKIILVGNKCDIAQQAVRQEDIDQFISRYQMDYITVSAKKNINVDALFNKITNLLIKEMPPLRNEKTVDITKSKKVQGFNCCG